MNKHVTNPKDKARFEEMKKLRFEEGWSLKEIAEKFSVSYQRVQQTIGNSGHLKAKIRKANIGKMKSLTNHEISEITKLSEKTISKFRSGQRHTVDGKNLRLGYEVEEYVSRKLTSLGIKNELMPFNHLFDILTDSNLRIEVRARNGSFYEKKYLSPRYRFASKRKKLGNHADFFILVVIETKEMFVIPAKYMPTYEMIIFCWPLPDFGKKTKWLNFYERWDLIKEAPVANK